MKKLLLLTAMLLSASAFGQNTKQPRHFIYCELIGPNYSFNSNATVDIDYGQATGAWGLIDHLKDSVGNDLRFNSMVDAMNYMDADGWEFIQSYATTNTVNNLLTHHWLLKKDVKALTKEEQDAVFAKFKVKPNKK